VPESKGKRVIRTIVWIIGLLSTAMVAVLLLSAASSGNDAVYPTEKVAAFVFDKVDVTSFPSAIRPKPLKGKKTFSDYGYVARELDEKNVRLDPPQGAPKISIEVLEAQRSGIYVCVNSQTINKGAGRFQRVFLLKLTGDGLLSGKETRKEFDACPLVGDGDQDSPRSSY
jgi:hypothetical protein